MPLQESGERNNFGGLQVEALSQIPLGVLCCLQRPPLWPPLLLLTIFPLVPSLLESKELIPGCTGHLESVYKCTSLVLCGQPLSCVLNGGLSIGSDLVHTTSLLTILRDV